MLADKVAAQARELKRAQLALQRVEEAMAAADADRTALRASLAAAEALPHRPRD